MKKIKYSWKQFDKDIVKIVKLINFKEFNSLAPIAFGGLILGTKLKNITELSTRIIFASSYKNQKRTKLNIKIGDLDKVKPKVLVLDDVSDSGITLSYIANYLKTKEIAYSTLTLFYKEGSIFKPDWYLHKVNSNQWINFPWEG